MANTKDAGDPTSDIGQSLVSPPLQSFGREGALPEGTFDPVYEAKARVLNRAIQEIGMGRYQWQLFIVIGFGWASDNLWPITTSLIFTAVSNEFSPSRPPLLTLAQNIGLLIGALFWGFGCDIFGRRWAFNLTIGITAFFGLLAASSPNFGAIAAFAALWSLGVGGNLRVPAWNPSVPLDNSFNRLGIGSIGCQSGCLAPFGKFHLSRGHSMSAVRQYGLEIFSRLHGRSLGHHVHHSCRIFQDLRVS
jgi:hypothetical protein